MSQPATAGIVVGSIFGGIALLYFSYKAYVRIHRFRQRRQQDADVEEFPPIRQPLSTYSQPYHQSTFATSPSGTVYGGGGGATFGNGMAKSVTSGSVFRMPYAQPVPSPGSRRGSSAGFLSPMNDSPPVESENGIELQGPPPIGGGSIDGRGTSTSSLSDGTNATEAAIPRRARLPSSSSSSTMALKRNHRLSVGSFSSSPSLQPSYNRRESWLPHSPLNRDTIQIVPPQPLGIGFGGLATAKDQKTLAFSPAAGIGLGDDLFSHGLVWTDQADREAALQQQQQQADRLSRAQARRSLPPMSSSGSFAEGSVWGSSIGQDQRNRYLAEGPASVMDTETGGRVSRASTPATPLSPQLGDEHRRERENSGSQALPSAPQASSTQFNQNAASRQQSLDTPMAPFALPSYPPSIATARGTEPGNQSPSSISTPWTASVVQRPRPKRAESHQSAADSYLSGHDRASKSALPLTAPLSEDQRHDEQVGSADREVGQQQQPWNAQQGASDWSSYAPAWSAGTTESPAEGSAERQQEPSPATQTDTSMPLAATDEGQAPVAVNEEPPRPEATTPISRTASGSGPGSYDSQSSPSSSSSFVNRDSMSMSTNPTTSASSASGRGSSTGAAGVSGKHSRSPTADSIDRFGQNTVAAAMTAGTSATSGSSEQLDAAAPSSLLPSSAADEKLPIQSHDEIESREAATEAVPAEATASSGLERIEEQVPFYAASLNKEGRSTPIPPSSDGLISESSSSTATETATLPGKDSFLPPPHLQQESTSNDDSQGKVSAPEAFIPSTDDQEQSQQLEQAYPQVLPAHVPSEPMRWEMSA